MKVAELAKVELNKLKRSCLFGLFYFESFHQKSWLSIVLALTLGTGGIQNSLLLSGCFEELQHDYICVRKSEGKKSPVTFQESFFMEHYLNRRKKCTCFGLFSAVE